MFKKKKNNRPDEIAAFVYAVDAQEALEKFKQKYRLTIDSFGGFAACFPKKKFNIDEWQGKYVMHCENQEELFKFYDYLHSVSRKLCSDRDYAEAKATLDAVGKPIKYIFFNEGMYASYMNKAYASEYTVLNFKDFDWSDFNMKETKFKVGDKVRVKSWLVPGHHYSDTLFTRGMLEFCGKVGVIMDVTLGGRFILDITGHLCHWGDEMLELVEVAPSFTKADLKPGMVVEYRDGSKAVFINDIFMEKHGWMPISDYYDDLINVRDSSCSSHYDICRVYNSKAFAVYNLFKPECLELIWERKEDEPVKEMTVAEIEKQLGHKVKIVDGE